MRRPWRSRLAAAAAAVVAVGGLAACGSAESGPPTLTWYINPDDGGQAKIAASCTAASGGKYTIATSTLPREASEQRQQLVRRLAANDSSIDIMSLDPPYIPEYAQAGFLAPVPPDVASRVTQGTVQSAIDGATWNGKLVTVPFWANTQLLWYKKSAAAAAGLDMTKPVTWEQLIQAAGKANTNIAAQGRRAESLTVWFNALLASAGGAVIAKNSTDPTQIQLGLQTPAGDRAAQVMSEFANSGREGPAFSTAGEDESVAAFQAGTAGWMVNWPFVWSKAKSGVKGGTLSQSVVDDYGWAIYPRVDADKDAAPPYGGINLGVGAFSKHPDLAYAATECITSTANQKDYFLTNGNPASRASVFSDPEVLKDFPMAPTIEQSLQLAAPRPQTPYYSEVSGSIQREYHPPANVSPATGASTTELIQAVLSGRQLL